MNYSGVEEPAPEPPALRLSLNAGEKLKSVEYDVLEEESFRQTINISSFRLTLQQPETIALIEYDLPRTFPTLAFFHDGKLIPKYLAFKHYFYGCW
jgi:hypothetical protein